MKYDNKDDIIRLTPLWTGERSDDGRPRVPDSLLERMRKLTLEEIWGGLWGAGYREQFEGELKRTHPERKLIGRAKTAVFTPHRPDLHETLLKIGREEEGRKGIFHQWVIDSLSPHDVFVVDLFDRIYEGTVIGGNLSTTIASRTGDGGAVIWGGIRDYEQIIKIPDFQAFYRGYDPTGIGNMIMTGMNVPCRIGKATCMPGDVVFGTVSGVLFVPPHLAETCVTAAEKSNVRDIFGFKRLKERVYTATEIDSGWSVDMWKDFTGWFEAEAPAEYRHLDWSDEIGAAARTDKKDDIRL